MIKVLLANDSQQKVGGGFTFLNNLRNTLTGKVEFTDKITECDIYFISGVSMVTKDHVRMARDLKKKIVVRIDGVPKNSRNRGCGTGRLFSYCEMASAVIYQSQWSKNFLMPFLKKDGPVILNGVDTNTFKPQGPMIDKQGTPQFLYVRQRRTERKLWEYAWYLFQKEYQKNPQAHLWIVGRFSPEAIKYKFDLFGGAENNVRYFGMIENKVELARIYRSADILLCPYINDPCPNVYAEAQASDLEIQGVTERSGGILEQIQAGVITLEEMSNNYLEVFNKLIK